MAKHELIEIDLELIAAHAVIGADPLLLQFANRSVGQRNDRPGALSQVDSKRLAARHVLVTSLMQAGEKLLRPSVYTMEPGSTFRFRKAIRVELLKSGMTDIRERPVPWLRFPTDR